MFGKKKIIALCTGKISEANSYIFLTELSADLGRLGYKLFVYTSCTDFYYGKPSEYGEESIFSTIDFDMIDALVLLDDFIKRPDVKKRIVEAAKVHKVPVITVAGYEQGTISVNFDDEIGFCALLRHLMKDHKTDQIHFIAGFKDNEESERRLNYFRRVLSENGIEVTDQMISYGDFWSGPTREAVTKLVEENRVPKIIVCANDIMAITACEVLQENGYQIPQDVIVTGYDGVEDVYLASPQISTCCCEYRDLAKEVTRILPDVCSGEITKRDFLVPPKVFLSQSCGCGAGKNVNLAHYVNGLRNRNFFLETRANELVDVSDGIQSAGNMDDVSALLYQKEIAHTSCVLYESGYDEKQKPIMMPRMDEIGRKRFLIYDYDLRDTPKMFSFQKEEGMEIFAGKLEDEYPLIFLALYSQQYPLGYLCFHFDSYQTENYLQIPTVVNAMNQALNGFRHIRYQNKLMKKLEQFYKTDALTGLLNRNAFYKAYDEMVAGMKEEDVLTVMMLDLNELKIINDLHGHNEGDFAIRKVADFTRVISTNNMISCRYGGDEMLMVTTDVISEDHARRRYDEFFECINRESGKPYQISAGFGYVRAGKEEAKNFEKILVRVDSGMYLDKEAKKQLR